jgi:hypothetical protein
LPSRKSGQPTTEENSRIYFAWFIQYSCGGEKTSYRTIAERYGHGKKFYFTFVKSKIDFVVKNLDPELQEPRVKKQVSLVLDAFTKKRKSLKFSTPL